MCGTPIQQPTTPETDKDMKTLLRQMFEAWILFERAAPTQRSMLHYYTLACDGDVTRGRLLELFDHWHTDVANMAAFYGLGLARKQPDGTLQHPDSSLDTLLKGGELTIIEVPPAPSIDHYWYKGQWVAPMEDVPEDQ